MQLTRRGVLTVLSALTVVCLVTGPTLVTAAPVNQVEPGAGTWPTWLIASGTDLLGARQRRAVTVTD